MLTSARFIRWIAKDRITVMTAHGNAMTAATVSVVSMRRFGARTATSASAVRFLTDIIAMNVTPACLENAVKNVNYA